MNSLPQEIVDDIVGLLHEAPPPRHERFVSEPAYAYPDLVPYASISIGFQHAVERKTFAFVIVDSRKLQFFRDVFNSPRRRSCLRQLAFQAVLPPYAKKYRGRIETEKDRQINNDVFFMAVKSLFEILRSWESETSGALSSPGLAFWLEAWSPSDYAWRKEPYFGPKWEDYKPDIKYHRFKRSQLALGDVENIPTLQCITRFFLYALSQGFRNIRPNSISTLAKKMPNLEGVEWYFSDDEKWARFHPARCELRISKCCVSYSLV
jgi:hypothetical protein